MAVEDSLNVRLYRGQIYRRVAKTPHIRMDGTQTTLTTWVSACAKCGASFEFRVPTLAKTFKPNRRCSLHHRPGTKARKVERDLACLAEA